MHHLLLQMNHHESSTALSGNTLGGSGMEAEGDIASVSTASMGAGLPKSMPTSHLSMGVEMGGGGMGVDGGVGILTHLSLLGQGLASGQGLGPGPGLGYPHQSNLPSNQPSQNHLHNTATLQMMLAQQQQPPSSHPTPPSLSMFNQLSTMTNPIGTGQTLSQMLQQQQQQQQQATASTQRARMTVDMIQHAALGRMQQTQGLGAPGQGLGPLSSSPLGPGPAASFMSLPAASQHSTLSTTSQHSMYSQLSQPHASQHAAQQQHTNVQSLPSQLPFSSTQPNHGLFDHLSDGGEDLSMRMMMMKMNSNNNNNNLNHVHNNEESMLLKRFAVEEPLYGNNNHNNNNNNHQLNSNQKLGSLSMGAGLGGMGSAATSLRHQDATGGNLSILRRYSEEVVEEEEEISHVMVMNNHNNHPTHNPQHHHQINHRNNNNNHNNHNHSGHVSGSSSVNGGSVDSSHASMVPVPLHAAAGDSHH